MSDDQLEATTVSNADSVSVHLRGELDLATADRAEDALLAAEAQERSSVILDLSGLRFIDSTGLRLVLRAHRRSREGGARLRLVEGPPEVQRVFRVTGTESLLPFAPRPAAR